MNQLEDLRQFVAGVDGGSFTAAAEARDWERLGIRKQSPIEGEPVGWKPEPKSAEEDKRPGSVIVRVSRLTSGRGGSRPRPVRGSAQ
ncbi:helix-turn-helix domain-containing protein [Azotobacter chroococcum]|uniref:helix-turn-helix domain-containing protein n=1 Tax=Azotobacter chroococcum TaxID=353 RepID=UPI001E4F438F|nr:LysR family transcriptional regulator [Azotobacter chroococcum]